MMPRSDALYDACLQAGRNALTIFCTQLMCMDGVTEFDAVLVFRMPERSGAVSTATTRALNYMILGDAIVSLADKEMNEILTLRADFREDASGNVD